MPSFSRVARVVRLVTLPETRSAIAAAARSETLRDIARRARTDRPALVRDLSNPDNAREIVGNAARHPATRELATAGLMFLPVRYIPLGWVATWAAGKFLRPRVDPSAEVVAPGVRRVPVKDVTRETP